MPGAHHPSWVPTDRHESGPDIAVIFAQMVRKDPNGEGEQSVILAEQYLTVCAWFTDNCSNYEDMLALATDHPWGSKDRILRDCFGTVDPFRFTNKGKGRAHEEPDPSRRRIGEAFGRDLQRRFLKSQKVLVTAQGIVRNARLASTPTATPATSTGTTVGAPSDHVGGARSKSAPSKANSPLGPPGIPLSDPSGAASSGPSGAVQNPPLHTDYAAFFAQEREHQGAQGSTSTYQRGQYSAAEPQGGPKGKAQVPNKGKGKMQRAAAPYPEVSHSTWQAHEQWPATQASQAPSNTWHSTHDWWNDWYNSLPEHLPQHPRSQDNWGRDWTPETSQGYELRPPRWEGPAAPSTSWTGWTEPQDPLTASSVSSASGYGKGTASAWRPSLGPSKGSKGTQKGKDPPWVSSWYGKG